MGFIFINKSVWKAVFSVFPHEGFGKTGHICAYVENRRAEEQRTWPAVEVRRAEGKMERDVGVYEHGVCGGASLYVEKGEAGKDGDGNGR